MRYRSRLRRHGTAKTRFGAPVRPSKANVINELYFYVAIASKIAGWAKFLENFFPQPAAERTRMWREKNGPLFPWISVLIAKGLDFSSNFYGESGKSMIRFVRTSVRHSGEIIGILSTSRDNSGIIELTTVKSLCRPRLSPLRRGRRAFCGLWRGEISFCRAS